MMVPVTSSPQASPARIPGYDGGPFRHRPELLDEHLFWQVHLHLGDAPDPDAGALLSELPGGDTWPVFTVPLAGDHRLYVVYRALEGEAGIDYLVHHPDWDAAETLAQDDGHYIGPGLSWAELTAAADNGLPGGSTTDPHARLLLLLPAFGDDAVPDDDAVERLAAALRARTRVEEPDRLAAVRLAYQGPWGPTHWTRADGGHLINDGGHSFRNPAHGFAWPPARLAQVATALTR